MKHQRQLLKPWMAVFTLLVLLGACAPEEQDTAQQAPGGAASAGSFQPASSTHRTDTLVSSTCDEPVEGLDEQAFVHYWSIQRSGKAWACLKKSSANDNPRLRYLALHALWQLAMDGWDPNEELEEILLNAKRDTEPQIVELAYQAFDDLNFSGNQN